MEVQAAKELIFFLSGTIVLISDTHLSDLNIEQNKIFLCPLNHEISIQ